MNIASIGMNGVYTLNQTLYKASGRFITVADVAHEDIHYHAFQNLSDI